MPRKRNNLTKAERDQVLGALRAGADMALAARVAGVSRSTLYKIVERCPSFSEQVDEARAFADDRVVKALFETALKGNVAAQNLWLKNRRPAEWRDKQEIEHGGTVEYVVTFEDDGELVS